MKDKMLDDEAERAVMDVREKRESRNQDLEPVTAMIGDLDFEAVSKEVILTL